MSTALTQTIDDLLRLRRQQKLQQLLANEKLQAIGEALSNLSRGKKKTFSLLSPERQAEVIFYVDTASRDLLLHFLADHDFAVMLHFADEDDAVDLLQSVDKDRRLKILSYLKMDKKRRLEALLQFHPESAGGLMDFNFLVVDDDMHLQEVIKKVRSSMSKQRQTPLVIAKSAQGELKGYLPYQVLMMGSKDIPITGLLKSLPSVLPSTDQEMVCALARKQRSEVIAVADEFSNVLGIIHLKDLLRVAEFEATEDIYKMSGVSLVEQVNDPVLNKVNRRYRWLLLNLITALFSSYVVSRFHHTIAQISILAAYMPIVAGLGGNTGTQTLAVVIRSFTAGEVSWQKARSIIFKETLTGFANGILVGSIAASVAILFGEPITLGLVLGGSMILNLLVGGLMGSLVPFILKALRIDPAVASSVFVTATTDSFGFLSFLGLGTLFLL